MIFFVRCNALNEYLLDSDGVLTLSDILDKGLSLYSSADQSAVAASKSGGASRNTLSDDDEGNGDDEDNDDHDVDMDEDEVGKHFYILLYPSAAHHITSKKNMCKEGKTKYLSIKC